MKQFKNVKGYTIGFIVGAVFTISSTGFADSVISKVDAYLNPSIPLIVDGKQLPLEKSIAIIDGSSYVPLKIIGDALGKSVNWNDTNKSIEMTSVVPVVEYQDISSQYSLTGNIKPEILVKKNNIIYVPVTFIAEVMNLKTNWNEADKELTLESDDRILKTKLNSQNSYLTFKENLNLSKLNSMEGSTSIYNGVTLIPLRFGVEIFGGSIDIQQNNISIKK